MKSTLLANNLTQNIILLALSISGIFSLILFYYPYFSSHMICGTIFFNSNSGIDVLGAIIPLLIGIVCTVFYIWQGLPKLPYLFCFLTSILVVGVQFLLYPQSNGLESNPGIISFFVSFIIAFFIIPLLRKKSLMKFGSLAVSLLLGLGIIPLSIIAFDVFYVAFYKRGFIGGYGLVDGVLLSTIYSLFFIILFSAFRPFLSKRPKD